MHWQGKKEIAMQLICLQHVRWNLLVIHLYMRSSCTPAHSWHQWFGFVTIYTLFRFVWLLFICRRKSVSKQHFWCYSKYSFFESGTGMRRERENDREKLYLCTCSISTVDHFENCLRSSDRIWQVEDGNCAICFWLRLIFHHLLAFVPALNEISCVGFRAPTSILVIAWEALGEKCIWEHFHMQFPTWELLDFLFLPSMKQVFEQPQRLILTCEIRQVTSSLCFFSNRWNIFNNSWLRYTAGPLFTAEDSGAAQCTPTLSPH